LSNTFKNGLQGSSPSAIYEFQERICQQDGIFVFVRPFVRSILSLAAMDRDSRPYVMAVK
jgi:hypothetical protein